VTLSEEGSRQAGPTTPLCVRIAAMHAGEGDPSALVEGFRDSVLIVPVAWDGRVWAAEWGGIRWIYAFSGVDELARFLRARGEPGDVDFSYLRVEGWRLLDVAVPAVGVPAGVALDVGCERPVMFPPVAGVVPNAVAVGGDGRGNVGD
jgi:hypothetical protein